MEQQTNSMGQWAEEAAKTLLHSHGYQCISQNYHSRFGEIDLIVRRGQELVFVEVKADPLGVMLMLMR